jgi:tetratricopeptide (TPR) repeat protein
MRRQRVLLIAAAALAAGGALLWWQFGGESADAGASVSLPAPASPPPAADSAGTFVGSARCAGCHQAEYAAWQGSTHAAAGGDAGNVRVIARFSGEIRFRDAVVIPVRRGAQLSFTVRQAGRPDQVFRVDGVVGGGHMLGGGTQGFVSRFADGTVRFLPFDFIRRENTWFCNTNGRLNRGWLPITAEMALADCGDWPPVRVLGDEVRFANCQSCHGSQISVALDSAAHAYRTTYTTLGINCEACHGPGERHIARVQDGAASGDIAMRALATVTKDQSLDVCWQCHALKDQLQPGYRSGGDLLSHYSTLLPILGDDPFYADGRIRTFAYQQGHLYSDCYRNGGMTCTSCHDPHSQRYRDVNGAPLPGRFDDRQCTSCHASKALAPAAHTRHAASSEGSRCVACHMPYLQEPEVGAALRYARSDHTIPIPRPAFDAALGVVNACAGCHRDRQIADLERQTREWYGELKPHPRAVTALLRADSLQNAAAAAELLLVPDERHTAALVAGLAHYAERYVTGGTSHSDLDVRALALASLHYAGGETSPTRRALRDALTSAGAEEWPLRRRWAVVLGYFADQQRARGQAAAAVATYGKARDVDPSSARVLLNLGIAQNESRDPAGAVQSFRESLALDPSQPLAHVNMGIALEAQNDLARAAQAYQAALRLNKHEPLAHFNLGNVYVKGGDFDAALRMYQRTRELDASLAPAHFMVARILARQGSYAQALAAVDQGLEFDRGNSDALTLREQIRAAAR